MSAEEHPLSVDLDVATEHRRDMYASGVGYEALTETPRENAERALNSGQIKRLAKRYKYFFGSSVYEWYIPK